MSNARLRFLDKIQIIPLNIKLHLAPTFVQALDENGDAFKHLIALFPEYSEANLKEGLFTGPDVEKMLQCKDFEEKMQKTGTELSAWLSFRKVVACLLTNAESLPFSSLQHVVKVLLTSFQQLGCQMSLTLHYLHAHLDFLTRHLACVSDERSQKCGQMLKVIEVTGSSQLNNKVKVMEEYLAGLH